MYTSCDNGLSANFSLRFSLRSLWFFLITFVIINTYELALAANTADPIGTQLCSIINVIQGNTVKAIAIAALISIGIGLFMGKVNWGVALTTAVGVIVLFGAPTLIGFLSGNSSLSSCSTSAISS
jgi:type IV secretory pathway VirB2 component (pilin)